MAREQGSQPHAKEDTRFYSEDATGLEVDLSQYLTDLTAAGNGGYELASTRTGIISPRTLEARWEATAGELNAGLIVHGNQATTDFTYILVADNAGKICGKQNGNTIWGSPVVAAAEYYIYWGLRPNPDATGASDAVISDYAVYDITNSQWFARGSTAHAASTTDPTWDLSVGGWWTGGGGFVFQPVNAPAWVRVSRAYHPLVEGLEEFGIVSRPAYSGTADDGIVEPVGPISPTSGMGDPGLWVGRHPWGYTAAHTSATAKRSWSLLVNDVFRDAKTVDQTPDNWQALAPGSADFVMGLQWLRWIALPTEATHARVRLHVTSSGGVAKRLRCYAFNRPPGLVQIGAVAAPALESFYVEANWIAPGPAGEQWLDLGDLRLPPFLESIPGWRGTVHLCLAYEDGETAVEVTTWHARPLQRFTPGGIDL